MNDASNARPYGRLGGRLLQLRSALSMTCADLARALRCTSAAISHVESGMRLPTSERLDRWAEALGAQPVLPVLHQLLREDCAAAVQAGARHRKRVMTSRIVRSA